MPRCRSRSCGITWRSCFPPIRPPIRFRTVQLETPPRRSTGKSLRSTLHQQVYESFQPTLMPADGPIEQLISAIFAALLNQRQPAGRDDNFFLLGGDSLTSLRVIHALEQRLDLELSPTLLFRQPICTIWLSNWPHFWRKRAGA